MERLNSESRYNIIDEQAKYNIEKVIYLQKKIKQYLKSKNLSYNNIKQTKQKNKMIQREDSENYLMIMHNSNLQNKLTSAKSQTFKNSSVNNPNESSHKEKYSKQSLHPKITKKKSKHGKSGKNSVKSEKIDSNNNNLGSEI